MKKITVTFTEDEFKKLSELAYTYSQDKESVVIITIFRKEEHEALLKLAAFRTKESRSSTPWSVQDCLRVFAQTLGINAPGKHWSSRS